MSLTRLTAALGLTLMVAACAPAGYYDSNGVYHNYGRDDTTRHDATPVVGGVNPVEHAAHCDEYYDQYSHSYKCGSVPVATTTIIYTNPGYYDRSGNYIAHGPQVPDDFLPPRGVCRIWYPDRAIEYQPSAESCTGIQYRVPAGAYVIFGG